MARAGRKTLPSVSLPAPGSYVRLYLDHERLDRMDSALLEIASVWGDVDEYIVRECDRLRDEIVQLKNAVEERVAEELNRDPGDAP